MATGQASNSTSADNLTRLNSHVGFPVGQPKNAMPSYAEPHFQFGQLDLPSHIMPNHHGDMKPFSLPSLASITANLTPASPEMSLLGPHRSSHHSLTGGGRRFSPLGTGADFKEAAPLEDNFPASFLDQGIEQKPNLSIAAVNRPRSRSLRSAQSLLETSVDDDTPKDESGSDSGRSDKRKGLEDADNLGSAKKRSRTLTTPTQQRRLMQILEQTRFPSTDLREQLARELGMTPRRVQIWFQNRRQGMKKAQEQRAEQEATSTSTNEYGRARGYSFGAYPAPPDVYPQAQGHQQPSLYGQGLPAYTSVALVPTHQTFDAFPSHLYGPRPTARDGMPRQLPQLHIQNNASNSSLSTLNESACSEFSWSEPSNNNNNWPEAQAGYPIPAGTTAVDRERMFPFEKRLSQPYESAHLQEFPSQAIQQPNLYHAQGFFHKPDEQSTPTQRLVTLGGEGGRPDRPNGLRNIANAYEEPGRTLRDQVGSQRPAVWNDALSRLNIADYRGSQFLKAEKQSPQRQSTCLGPSESNPNQEDAYPLEYSTVDYTESIIGRSCGEISNGLTPPDYVEFSSNPHLHLTEPHLLNEANDLDKYFHGTSSPDPNRKRRRSLNG